MNRIRLVFLIFCGFLATVITTADKGLGSEYWGWLRHVPLGDKVCHFGLMFTLCVLTNLVLKCRVMPFQGHRMILLGTVIVAIVVVGEEFSQIWIPGRTFDLFDLTADFLGIAAGNLVAKRTYPVLIERGDPSRGIMA